MKNLPKIGWDRVPQTIRLSTDQFKENQFKAINKVFGLAKETVNKLGFSGVFKNLEAEALKQHVNAIQIQWVDPPKNHLN